MSSWLPLFIWLPQSTGCQDLPTGLVLLLLLALVGPAGMLFYVYASLYKEMIHDAIEDGYPAFVIYIVKVLFYTSITAIVFFLLFALIWKFGKLKRDQGDLIVPPEPVAYNALDREVFAEHGEALEGAARIVWVKHDKAYGKLSTLGPKIIQLLKFDANPPGIAGVQRDPLFAVVVIGHGRVNQAPGTGFFVNSEPNKVKDSYLLVREVHHVNTPVLDIQREGSREGDSRKTTRSVFGPHNLKGLLSDLDHLVSHQSHRGGSQKHEELDASVKQLHSISLTAASELDRILREGLKGGGS